MEAFVTLTTNSDYCKGAVVLGKSLRNAGTSRRLVVLVGRGVSPSDRDDLATVWDELVDVDIFSSTNPENLELFSRPELGVTLTKLHAWKLTQYEKCVFLDADTLVVQNVDDLFTRPELSAAPDVGWPDCFNSGVFVFAPSLKTFNELLQLLERKGTFDGGDQGLLNSFWSDWSTKDSCHRLPFSDNQTVSPIYTYTAAYKEFGHNARILHFLGTLKPWHHAFSTEHNQLYLNSDSGPDQRSSVHQLKQWWGVYCQWADSANQGQRPAAQGDGSSAIVAPAQSPSPPSPAQGTSAVGTSVSAGQDEHSRQRWEQGRPDYYGEENISHVEAHLQKMLTSPPSPPSS